MTITVLGVVKNGYIVPNSPIPEGTQVKIRLCDKPSLVSSEDQGNTLHPGEQGHAQEPVAVVALADFFDPVEYNWSASTWEIRQALQRYNEQTDANR